MNLFFTAGRSKPNYKAWTISPADFPASGTTADQLFFLLNYAVLAPSSHNSQPWQFAVSDRIITIYRNPAIELPVADGDGRLLYIALGAALENIIVAGDYFGMRFTVRYFPAGESSKAVAELTLTEAMPADRAPTLPVPHDHLIFSIPRRETNRAPYESSAISPDTLAQILPSSTDEARIDVVSDSARRQELARIIMDWRVRLFDGADFRSEIARYKRHNLTSAPDGMPGFTMGFPLLLSLLASRVIRRTNVMRKIRGAEEKLLSDETPILLIFSARGRGHRQQLELGRLLMQTLLRAERAGFQTAVSASAHPDDPAAPQVKKFVPDGYQPYVLCRLGKTARRLGHSPRLQPAQAIVSAKD